MIKSALKPAALAIASILLLSSGISQAADAEKATEYRQGVMNILSWNSKAIGAMLKGEAEYNADSIKRHAADINRVAGLDIIAGFPEDSETEDSAALADIWMDFGDFETRMAEFTDAAAKLDMAAQGGDQAAVGAAMKDLGASCKSCHKKYKN